MPIPTPYRYRSAYHFTSINNLEAILKTGLLSPNEQKRLGIRHQSIAEKGIQLRRSEMDVSCGPCGKVHDYVPFYFCERSSMLNAVIRKKNIDQQFLIYLSVPITIAERQPCVFASASANTAEPPTFFDDPDELASLKWDLIDSRKWKLSDSEKQLRMAELLVYKRVEVKEWNKIIVWNTSVKEAVAELFDNAKLKAPPIVEDGRFYFNKYPDAPNESLVTGPFFTKQQYEESVKYILDKEQNGEAPYANYRELLRALKTHGLKVLPETAELIGLKSDNLVHEEDAGTHTLSVVRELIASDEFRALDENDQPLVELAAFLHDIGKGPKSRWASNNGKQKVDPDHPIGSVKMLKRILTEEVREIKPRSVRVLCKLVCYHDLLGDIVGKGRDLEQLQEVAEKSRHLDMLIALGLADVKAINHDWHLQCQARAPELRDEVLQKINHTSSEDE
jgi:hypothetical protein